MNCPIALTKYHLFACGVFFPNKCVCAKMSYLLSPVETEAAM